MKWISVFFVSLCFLYGNTKADDSVTRIIGGKNANIEDFPYQASLRFVGKHTCGASIISEKHVLTAAHCLYDQPLYFFFTVHTGTSSLNSNGHTHRISRVNIHPGYTGSEESSVKNDIAIITLQNSIAFDKYQQKIKLPSHKPQDGQVAVLTGWGLTSNKATDPPPHLQKSEMKLITSSKCQSSISTRIYKEQICAFHHEGVGACRGDSGGPLVVNGEIIGIVSFVDGELCAPGFPDVYTNVYYYLDYIKSVMQY